MLGAAELIQGRERQRETTPVKNPQDVTMEKKPKKTAPSPGQPLDGQGVRRISRFDIVKSNLRIGTWNVRSLYAAGKFDNAIKEAQRLNVQILGISELRWPDSGQCRNEHGTLYYSGSESHDRNHRNGVGIFVSAEYSKYVANFLPISDRLILIQLHCQPFNMNIIQIYASTSDKRYDQEVESLYDTLNQVLSKLKSNDINLIIGDFNAKIGKGRRSDLVGEFGIGLSNHRGDRLYEFCQNNDMIIANTWFKLPKRRLYTWVSPAEDNSIEPIRNQIDYVLINRRFRNTIKRVTTYPGADIGSDHVPLIADLRVRLKVIKQGIQKRKWDLSKLENTFIKDQMQQEITRELNRTENTSSDVPSLWKDLKDKLINVCNRYLKSDTKVRKKRWMTTDILNLMEKRRLVKTNKEEYKGLNKIIRREVKIAKERWIREMCEEMEEMEKKHDIFQMHRKVRDITGMYRKQSAHVLIDPSNQPVIRDEEIKETWETYINELFDDNRGLKGNNDNCFNGPKILKEEILHAISITQNKKATGPDEIPIEVIKLIAEENMGPIIKLFNLIYTTGTIPEEWLKSTFITIPKKLHPKKCSDYRLISLMSHLLKVFLRIIHSRIRTKCEFDLDNSQMGFRNAFGTREALFGVNVLLQKCRDQRKDVFVCFVDYEKAFDRVRHDRLISILQQMQLDDRDVRIIENLYWGQTAEVHMGDLKTNSIRIQRGVRQGCILSPLLFNLYSDRIFKEALGDVELGVKVNGVVLNTIRYADDTLIMCDSLDGLQTMVDKINEAGQGLGLNINVGKTKFMVFSRSQYDDVKLILNHAPIERVHHFKYLGSIITDDLDPDIEIRCRIEAARTSFKKMSTLLRNDSLNLKLRQRMAKCYIWSVLLYGVECWTVKVSTLNRLEAFEMWIHRRMLRIPWTDLLTNEEVLRRANSDRLLITTIKCRKIAYLGHILRGEKYYLLQLIMKGKIEGRRGVGRKQMSWLKNIREWTGIQNAGDLFRLAEDREALSIVIANVRVTGYGT